MKTMGGMLMAVCLLTPLGAQSGGPPAGAESIGRDAYRHKDRDGVVWIYRKKPFGWAKSRELDEKAAQEAPKPAATPVNQPVIKVVALKGDVVSFETPSAFGKRFWTNKHSDLTPDEKAALEKWEAARVSRKK